MGSTGATAGWITALYEEALDNTVKDGIVVIAFQAQLDEVPDGLWGLFRPEFDVQWPVRGVKNQLALCRRLEHVNGRHYLPPPDTQKHPGLRKFCMSSRSDPFGSNEVRERKKRE